METKNQEKENSLKKEEQLNEKVFLSDEQLEKVAGGLTNTGSTYTGLTNMYCARQCEATRKLNGKEGAKCMKKCMLENEKTVRR